MSTTIALREIAYARSGDKGSGANVGILAYTADGYAFLEKTLTSDRVEAFFRPMGVGKVIRYELPNLHAFNFLLPNILAGGGSRSLRVDAQGKALGMALLEMRVDIDDETLAKARP